MRLPPILLLVTLCFYSCKSNRVDSLQDVLTAISPAEQETTIDPSTENIVEGKKGTRVFIPANAFQFKDGSRPSAKIEVRLKEFYSVSEFMSNNLSTLSDSFLLETGGMLFISATVDGKELEIDKQKSCVIAFPGKKSGKEMNIFYGDTAGGKNINWQPGPWQREGGFDDLLMDSSLYDREITICGYTSDINGQPVQWGINHPDSSAFEYIRKNFKPSDTALANYLCRSGKHAGIYIDVDKNGKIINIDFNSIDPGHDPTPQPLRKAITDFLKTLPLLKPTKDRRQGDYLWLDLCCHSNFNREKYNERFKNKYSQYRDKAIEKIDPSDLNYYVLSTSRLGWINCDHFLDDSTEKTDFIVKLPEIKEAQVMIVFENIRSIMQGKLVNGEFRFPNVPVSSKVTVIGISYRDGKPLLSKMAASINKQAFTLSEFREFSLEELEQELNN
jgi:hypothetical protein